MYIGKNMPVKHAAGEYSSMEILSYSDGAIKELAEVSWEERKFKRLKYKLFREIITGLQKQKGTNSEQEAELFQYTGK